MTDNDLINRDTLLKLLGTPIISLAKAKELIGIQEPITVYNHGELEHTTIPHNCVNCGGKVSKLTGVCLYCGTEY